MAAPNSLFRFNANSPVEIMKRTWAEIRTDDVFGRAAQLAYYFFLALFPFLICVVASLSVFGNADRGRALIFGLFARFLPIPAFQLVSGTFSGIIRSSGPLKMSFGILVSLWSASMAMGAVMDTLNAAYKATESRSLLRQYAVAIGLTFGIALLLVLSVLLVLLGDKIAATFSSGGFVVTLWGVVQWPLGLALLLLGFAIIYYFAPDLKSRRWHWISPGAIASVILLIAVSFSLRIYLRYAGSYGTAYGSLGAVIVLLLFFYMSGVVVLAGGVLNGVLERQSTETH